MTSLLQTESLQPQMAKHTTKWKRPEMLEGRTLLAKTPCGGFYLTLNECDNQLCEVRMLIGKSGNCVRVLFETIAILISVMLQENISKDKITKTLLNQLEANCGNTIWVDGDKYTSCIDYAVTKIIEQIEAREGEK